jgi:hypothetical protein
VVQVYDSAKSGMQDPLGRGLTVAIRARIGTRTKSNTFPRGRKTAGISRGLLEQEGHKGNPSLLGPTPLL